MLKLWVGYPGVNLDVRTYDNKYIVRNPDVYFDEMYDFPKLDTEFGHRLLKDVCHIVKVHNYATLELANGELISPTSLASGVKNVLLMQDCSDEVICDLLWCGENCEPFIAELAEKKDFTVCSRREFFPNFEQFKSGILVLNTNKVVHDIFEYWKETDDLKY